MLKAYKTVLVFFAGALLSAFLYNAWYYLQVLRWVDAIRIEQALKQVAAQQQAPPPKAP